MKSGRVPWVPSDESGRPHLIDPLAWGGGQSFGSVAMQTGVFNSSHRLEEAGITGLGAVHYNLQNAALVEAAIKRGEGELGRGGAFLCSTGKHTGQPIENLRRQSYLLYLQIDQRKMNQLLIFGLLKIHLLLLF